MSMLLRRQMMRKASGDWRDLYQQVAYLQSFVSSTQKTYINTGIVPNSSMRVVVDAESPVNTNASFVFGSRKNTAEQRFWFVTWQGSAMYGFGSDHNITIKSMPNSTRYVADFNHTASHTMTVDSTSIDAQATTETYTYPIFLFTLNGGGNPDTQQSEIKVYSFQIFNSYQDTEPILNFIPCYRKSDNKPGMYDTVSGTFYTNAGTGEFVVGPDVTPEGYIKSGLALWLDGINIGGSSGEWVDLIGGKAFAADTSAHTPTRATNGYTFNGSQWLYGPNYKTGEFSTSTSTVEISISNRSGTQGIIFDGCSGVGAGFYGDKFYGCINTDSTLDLKTSGTISATTLTASAQNGKIIINGAEETLAKSEVWSLGNFYMIARQSAKSAYSFTGTIHSIRIYSRLLTADEMRHNQHIDNARFNLGLTI